MTTTHMPPVLREAAEHVAFGGADFDDVAEELAESGHCSFDGAVEALLAAIGEVAPAWLDIDDVVASASIQSVPGMVGTIRKATYEPHGSSGAAAYGWGDTDEAARKSLRRCLTFNLRHNGRLV